jgi:3-oxoacyl-[acyl-carrier-protein] synthase-3
MARPVYCIGSGSYLPGDPVAFDDIGKRLGELTDAPQAIRRWIDRTHPVMKELLGIRYLHYAFDPATGEYFDDNVTMSVKAARTAIERAGIAATDIDLICYGSPHQDQMPTASVRIQERLGIERCDEFSIHANCTSAYKALYLAHELIKNGRNTTALVVSANCASSELRASYYNQALVDKESLFLRWFLCDGAGACVLSADERQSKGFTVEHTFIESVGGGRPSLMFNFRPAYWMNPREEFATGRHHLRQQFRNSLGTGVFQERGGSVFFNGLRRMLREGAVPVESIRYFQINFPARHIIESVMDECRGIGIPPSAFYTKLDEYGYSGPPAALIGLDSILRSEPFSHNDRIVSFVTEVSKFMQAGYSIRYDRPAD